MTVRHQSLLVDIT